MNLQLARLGQENLFFEHLDEDSLKDKQILVDNFCSSLRRIVDLDQEQISMRLRVPFEENHIALNPEHHHKMIDLVEGAFTDVLSSREDVDLAKWSQSACAPVSQLV